MNLTTDNVLAGVTPDFSTAEVEALLRAHWGLPDMEITPLGSERDLNFKIAGSRGRFVLKIANQAEPLSVTRLQTRALLHVAKADPEVPAPRVVATGAGADEVFAKGSTIRLLTWMDGIPWHLARRGKAQRQSIARSHARLTLALAGLTSDEPPSFLQWDVQHAGLLRNRLEAVAPPLRDAVEAALDLFDRHAAPRLAGLRRQHVHNDIQPHNVVVDENDPDRLVGILDFGDLVHSAIACDLGVACAYHVQPASHPYETLGEYLAAFHAILPLNDDELEALPALVMARHVSTIVIAGWRLASHPENGAYIMRNQPMAAAGLAQLLPVAQADAVAYLRSVLK